LYAESAALIGQRTWNQIERADLVLDLDVVDRHDRLGVVDGRQPDADHALRFHRQVGR
jgi:hypothetical protein